MSTLRTGRKIGNYRIAEQIGGGAMGRVWRGVDEALSRPVAVKMLRGELSDHPELIERFRIEARILARLSHPNVAMVYALVEEADQLYLVMEYVKGETLDSYLDRHGPLDLNACFALFHQALDGIQHAHEAGVVHRDIKSSNLMLHPTGQIKWIDFGIALVQGRERMTREGGLMGTPEYMSPEQVRGEPGTIRSDVYSLGIVLYRMLTGKRPFSGTGEYEVMRAHVETLPPRPSEHGAAIDGNLETVLLQALAKDPAERFPSAAAFQEALIEAGAPEPVSGGTAAAASAASEITLFDVPPRAGDPEAPALAPTRPDFDMLDDEPPCATVRDADVPVLGPAGAARSPWLRTFAWLGAAIVLGGLAAAIQQIAWSDRALRDPPATRSRPAEAASQPSGAVAPAADADAEPMPASEAPPGAEEPAAAPRSAPAAPKARGWEIVR
jgi:serine/threonine-protein kinase